jgi:hypothetical protein
MNEFIGERDISAAQATRKIRKFLFILRLTFDLLVAVISQAQQTQMTS